MHITFDVKEKCKCNSQKVNLYKLRSGFHYGGKWASLQWQLINWTKESKNNYILQRIMGFNSTYQGGIQIYLYKQKYWKTEISSLFSLILVLYLS